MSDSVKPHQERMSSTQITDMLNVQFLKMLIFFLIFNYFNFNFRRQEWPTRLRAGSFSTMVSVINFAHKMFYNKHLINYITLKII